MGSSVRRESVSDYAQRTGMPEPAVYKMIRSGELRASKRRPLGRGAWHWIIETPVEFGRPQLIYSWEDEDEGNQGIN